MILHWIQSTYTACSIQNNNLSGTDTVNCRGRAAVQDYILRSFRSFGFHCDWPRIHSLQGLEYNISFTDQSNDTNTCTDYSIFRYIGYLPSTVYVSRTLDGSIFEKYTFHMRVLHKIHGLPSSYILWNKCIRPEQYIVPKC